MHKHLARLSQFLAALTILALPPPGMATTKIAPIARGPGLVTHAMVYDPETRRVLAFGGDGHSHEVWALDLEGQPRWSRLEIVGGAPCSRRSASAILDPVRRRMIVFGGFNGAPLDDLWELRLEAPMAWAPMTPEGKAPPALAASTAVYDPMRDRMLLIHGNDGVGPGFRNAGVWALELSERIPRWTRLATRGSSPAPRSAHSAIYDVARERVIVFGGSTPELSGELWELRLDGEPEWNRLETPEPRPEPREEHAAIYDPVHQQMLIYGGTSGYEPERAELQYKDDVWALSLDGPPRWRQLAGSPGKRWGHRAVWDPIAERMIVHGGRWATAPDLLTAAFTPDAPEASPEIATAELVPERLALRIPRLVRGALAFRMFLPSDQGAKLELYDLAGRRAASQTLTGLRAGAHDYVWKETGSAPAGVFWLRVSSGRETVTEKVVRLH